METKKTCQEQESCLAFPVGASIATGLVDAGVVSGVAYAVTKKFSLPLFVGVGLAAAGIAFCALALFAVASEAEEAELYA